MGGCAGLERRESTTCTSPGLRHRSPWIPEESHQQANPNTGLPLQTRRRVTNSTTYLRMSACTACTPPELRLTTWECVVALIELNYKFILWVGVVVLKELIFNSFYFQQTWWS